MAIKKLALLAGAAVLFAGTPAFGQATRTWVSGVGDDVNPCSRTAPCKTFAGAISKTAAGGEINCLDPGGFGAVTINKSMTINCLYTEGGVLAGGNGIVVNAAATDTIFLRGLDIFGVNPPTNGVRIVLAGAVHIEDSTIRRFNSANSRGISFQPSNANAELHLRNVTIAENGTTGSGGGILIQPTGTGSATVTMTNVSVRNNAHEGIRIDTSGSSGARNNIRMTNVESSGNTAAGLNVVGPFGNGPVSVMVQNSSFASNSVGISVDGLIAVVRVSGSTIFGNTAGLGIINGGSIFSYGDNLLDGNPDNAAPNNGTFTGAVIPKR